MSNKTAHQLKYEGGKELFDAVGDDESVMYSEKAGFFIQKWIWQRRIGRTWEEMSHCEISSEMLAFPPENIRQLKTFRPITRDQAIRIYFYSMEDVGGIAGAIKAALDAAGIEPLKE